MGLQERQPFLTNIFDSIICASVVELRMNETCCKYLKYLVSKHVAVLNTGTRRVPGFFCFSTSNTFGEIIKQQNKNSAQFARY